MTFTRFKKIRCTAVAREKEGWLIATDKAMVVRVVGTEMEFIQVPESVIGFGVKGVLIGVTGKVMRIEKSKVEILHDLQEETTSFAQLEDQLVIGTGNGSIYWGSDLSKLQIS